MMLRTNPGYSSSFLWDRNGLLLITKRWIFAVGTFATSWA
jgi:hypothetical protein